MKPSVFVLLALAAPLAARADFSYTTTARSTGGMMAGVAAAGGANRGTRHLLKGDKMKLDHGDFATIIDFGAQTLTRLDHARKTFTVSSLADPAAKAGQTGAEIQADVEDTGQRKTINGYDARLFILTMDVDSPQMRRPGADTKMRMTIETWASGEVPGAQEMRSFYQRNAARTPWEALQGGGAGSQPGMTRAMADLQRKMASVNGVPVLQVVKMGASGNDPRMAQAQDAMAQARAKLEEMRKKGGEQAKAAEALGGMFGGPAAGAGSLMEMTIESGNFSTNSIPAAEFEVPPGYQKTDR